MKFAGSSTNKFNIKFPQKYNKMQDGEEVAKNIFVCILIFPTSRVYTDVGKMSQMFSGGTVYVWHDL